MDGLLLQRDNNREARKNTVYDSLAAMGGES